MKCCHEAGVIHRDLKLENVMFETSLRNKIRVVDFGISGLCRGDVAERNECATVRYMTPEMINRANSRASPAMDVWAIGIMCFCMLFHRMPFNGETKEEIKKKITSTNPSIPRSRPITAACRAFVLACLVKEPEQRITIE